MSERYKRWSTGERFQPIAAQLNGWTEASIIAQMLLRTQAHQRGEPRQPGRIPVANSAGLTLTEFSVLQLSQPLFDSVESAERYKSLMAFAGVLVEEDDVSGFAIVQRPLVIDQVDPDAVLAGATPVRLVGPTGQTHAGPRAGTTTLQAASTGPCEILHDPGPATTERIAIVKFAAFLPTRISFLTQGDPVSGQLLLDVDVYVIDPGTGTGSWETAEVSIPCPATLAELRDAFESHPHIGSDRIRVEAAGITDPDYELDVFPRRQIVVSGRNGLPTSFLQISAVDDTQLIGGAHVPYTSLLE